MAVITAIYDSYDTLKPVRPQSLPDVDWVLVTDSPRLAVPELGWRVVHEPCPEGLHPNRAAKRPKMRPWEYTDAPASVWLDASFRVVSNSFAADMLALADPIAQFTHPWRDCAYTEAAASAGIPKYAGEDFHSQTSQYRMYQHPEHWGLWATGVIARQHDDPQVRFLGEEWSKMITEGTFQDQVSQPVALRLSGLRPAPLQGTHLANRWVAYEGSGRH